MNSRNDGFPPIMWIVAAYVTLSALWAVIFVNVAHRITFAEHLQGLWEVGLNLAYVLVSGVVLWLVLSQLFRQYRTVFGYLAKLLDGMSEAVISTNQRDEIVSWNRAAEWLYGWRSEEVVGKSIHETLVAQAPPGAGGPSETPGAGKSQLSGEQWHRRMDGGLFPVMVSVSALHDARGQQIGRVFINQDITERRHTEDALRDSEALYRAVFDSSLVAIGLSSDDGSLIAYNQAMREMVGYTPAEVERIKNVSEFYYDPNDRPPIVNAVREKGFVANVETRMRAKDGSPVDVLLSVRRIILKDKPYIHTIAQDVSEQKRIIEALRLSEERFRRVFEDGPMGMSMGTLKDGFIKVNRAECEMLGYTEEELLGRSWADFTHPDDIAEDARQTKRLHAGEIPGFQLEKRLIRKDGSIVWIHLTAFLMRDSTGAPSYGLGIIKDITDRKLAEARLRESEERYRRLAENAPDVIFRWLPSGGYEYISPAVAHMTGYSVQEYYDDPTLGYNLVLPEDQPATSAYHEALGRGDKVADTLTMRVRRKDGRIVTQEARINPVYNERGEIMAYEGIVRDVTQQHIDRARLSELGQRLAAAHEEERRRIATELHDEIGQSLIVARVRLELALNQLPTRFKKVRAELDVVNAALEESMRGVRGLSHELRPPLLDEMGWQTALNSLCDSFSRRAGLRVERRHTGKSLRLPPDVELAIYRVAQEALTNALRHARATRVVVKSAFAKKGLSITIKDNGRGFDVEEFRRARHRDAGLGLLLMQERLSAVNGALKIVSKPGHGAAFIAEFPAPTGGKG